MGKFVVGERYKVDGEIRETGNIIEITKIDRDWCYYKTVKGGHAPGSFMPNSTFGRELIPVAARKFKVGDKVIGNDLADENYAVTRKGYVGTVKEVRDGRTIKVDRWVVLEECFDLFEEEEKIVITRKGKKTIAKYYVNGEVMEKGLARCCPEDTFDFETGTWLAVFRMFEAMKNSAFDWNSFANGDIFVEVTRETIADFLKECEKNDCNWCDHAATEWNPFESYDRMPEELKGLVMSIGGAPDDEVRIHVVDGNLMFRNRAPEDTSKVIVWEKSFDWEAFKNAAFAVKLTEENVKSFMEEAEKNGCVWRGGEKPTEWIPDEKTFYLDCSDSGYGRFGWSRTNYDNLEVVEW